MDTSGFQSVGEVCESCRERWEPKKKKLLRKLVALPKTTQRYHSVVAVCSYCDGEAIINIANANEAKKVD